MDKISDCPYCEARCDVVSPYRSYVKCMHGCGYRSRGFPRRELISKGARETYVQAAILGHNALCEKVRKAGVLDKLAVRTSKILNGVE